MSHDPCSHLATHLLKPAFSSLSSISAPNMLARSVQPQSARLRGAVAVRNGYGSPLPRASVLRHSSPADPPDAAQQQPVKAAPKPQRTGPVNINAGDLHLHIDAVNVHLTGNSLTEGLASALKSAVLDAAPSAVASCLATPTGQPAPPAPLAPLVPPFTCICEVKNPDLCALAMCSDGHHFVCGNESGEVALWDVLKPGQRLVAALANKKRVQSVAVSEDCRRVLVGCGDGLWMWDVEQGRSAGLMEYGGYGKAWQERLDVRRVAMSLDGSFGVSGWDKGLRVWDLHKGECLGMADTVGHVVSVSVSPSGGTATVLVEAPHDNEGQDRGQDCRLQVWKWHAGRGFSTPVELQDYTRGVELGVTADGGAVLAADYYTGDVHRWDVRSSNKEAAFSAQAGVVDRLALSADGRRAVLGSCRGDLWVLDVERKACLATLRRLEGMPAHMGHAIRCLAISPDGHRAASYSRHNKRLCIWHLG